MQAYTLCLITVLHAAVSVRRAVLGGNKSVDVDDIYEASCGRTVGLGKVIPYH